MFELVRSEVSPRMQETLVFVLYFYMADNNDCFFFWCIALVMDGDISFNTA